jgi:hypothetical protein
MSLSIKSRKEKNKSLNIPQLKLIDRDTLLLGWFCCDKHSNLINLLVDYYINCYSFYVDPHDSIEEWIVKFEAHDTLDYFRKKELSVMKKIFPIYELLDLLYIWVPREKVTRYSILLMLKKCTYVVHIASTENNDLDRDLDRDSLVIKTLDLMKKNLPFLNDFQRIAFDAK